MNQIDDMTREIKDIRKRLDVYSNVFLMNQFYDNGNGAVGYNLNPFRLVVGNGPEAQPWRHDELLNSNALEKTQKESQLAWQDYLQRMGTTKFP